MALYSAFHKTEFEFKRGCFARFRPSLSLEDVVVVKARRLSLDKHLSLPLVVKGEQVCAAFLFSSSFFLNSLITTIVALYFVYINLIN